MILYNLFLTLYAFGIRLASLWGNQKAAFWIEGRKDWRKKVSQSLRENQKRIWFHCSSLGEFEQGRPVIEKFRLQNPELKIVLTFFSPSGYEVRKNYDKADYVFYLPHDFKRNARDFINLIQPEEVFFIKYDFWFNYLKELKKRKIPLYFISSTFREGHHFFKWYGGFFRRMLGNVTHFFVQDEQSKKLLSSIGYMNATVSGDTRFDRVVEVASHATEIKQVESFKDGKQLFIAGSSWHEDELLIAELIKSLIPDPSPKERGEGLKFVIVPHEITHHHIGALEYLLIEKAGLIPDDIALYSRPEDDLNKARVLIIDTIGLLSFVYRYGEVAYIGGGFGKGIHNVLEAAVYGIPVIFGPKHEKFNEAVSLIKEGAAHSLSSSTELNSLVKKYVDNPVEREKEGVIARKYVYNHAGATDMILRHLYKN